jgi:hypothetical protein
LLITFLISLLGDALIAGPGSLHSADTSLIEEGFLLGCYFVLACWIAIAITTLVEAVGRGLRRRKPQLGGLGVVLAVCSLLIAGLLVVPSVIEHRSTADRDAQPLADRYASTELGELPRHAVLFILGAELTQPLIYRQVVDHDRPDVVVVAADGLSYDWYRQQVERRLGVTLPPISSSQLDTAAAAIKYVSRFRPVYLDPQAAQQTASLLGYRPVGLIDKLTAGVGPQPVTTAVTLDNTVLAAEEDAGMPEAVWDEWPNDYVLQAEYDAAELEVARAFNEIHDVADVRRAFENVLAIDPGDPVATYDLALSER